MTGYRRIHRAGGQALVETALVVPILLVLFAIILLLTQWLAVAFTVIRTTEQAAQQIAYRPQQYTNGERWIDTRASVETWQIPDMSNADANVRDIVLYGLRRPWIVIGMQRLQITIYCQPDRQTGSTCARYRPFQVDVEVVTSPWIPPLIPLPELTFRHSTVGVFQQEW